MDKLTPKPPQAIHTDAFKVTLTGKNRILVETVTGQKITIEGNDRGVTIEDAAGDSIQLQGGNIQIRATAQVSVQCSNLQISAAMITVDAAMTKFSGEIQADTVITNTVVANTYTPGAGNVW